MTSTTRTWWAGIVALALLAEAARADAPEGTRAIEQDWRVELYSVSDPNGATRPVFVSAFTIPGSASLFQVTWNQRTQPAVQEGGIQLEAYHWTDLMEQEEVVTPPWREKLSSVSEVVTWTQRLQVESGIHAFTVKNIVGTTWGTIAGEFTVKGHHLVPPGMESYTYAAVANVSKIEVGANRFKKLVIAQTRFYDAQKNLLLRDTAEKVLFSQPQNYQYFEFRQLNE
jgi:hypothetical protein